MIYLRQSTASQEILLGPFLDKTDGNTAETTLTIANTDIKLWKMGSTTLSNKNSGGATHISQGLYYATLDATDTNTLGSLIINCHISATALAVRVECCVLPATIYDSWIAGTDYQQIDLIQIGGDTQSGTDLKDFADAGYDPATNKVEGVKLVDTTTTNTDMRGTDSALLAASAPTNFGDLAITATTGQVTVGTNNDKTGYSISGTKQTLDALNDVSTAQVQSSCDSAITANTDINNIDTGVNNIEAKLPTNFIMGSSDQTDKDDDIDAILVDTNITIPAQISALNDFDPANDAVANVTLVDTTTTNTDMRGTDSAALAIVCTETRLSELDSANIPTDLSGISTQITSLNDLSASDVNAEIVDCLNVDTYAEPGQGNPPATNSLISKISYLYKMWRNKKEQTEFQFSLYNDAGTVIDQKSDDSDDGTTATSGEVVSGA